MKLTTCYLLAATLLLACGDPPDKDPSNNGTTTNGATNSDDGAPRGANNGAANNGAANNGVVANNGVINNPISTPCETRADCASNQECKAGSCADHISCVETGGSSDCWGEWNGCEDGKDYVGECTFDSDTAGAFCTCTVNDVEVATFELTSEELGSCESAPHRTFNERCDWLVADNK